MFLKENPNRKKNVTLASDKFSRFRKNLLERILKLKMTRLEKKNYNIKYCIFLLFAVYAKMKIKKYLNKKN